MKKVRLGFVGAGFMGQVAHLSNYAVLDECEVVALAEPRKKLAQRVAERYGIEEIYNNHKELLKNADVDGIVASQPFSRHIMIIPDILQAGIPVFTEKPLAASVESGEKLVQLAEDNDVLHMVGYHKRSDPAVEYAHDLIKKWQKSGEFGKMRYVRITMPPGDWIGGAENLHLSTDEDYPEGESEKKPDYFDREIYEQYISFVNYYIHQVNALRYLLREPYQLVFADKSETLLVTESPSGVCGTIEMAPYSTSVNWEETMLVGFERGYIKIELPAPLANQKAGTITIMKDHPQEKQQEINEPVLPPLAAMRNQASNFIAAIKGEKEPPCISKEALEDLKIARDYINFIKK